MKICKHIECSSKKYLNFDYCENHCIGGYLGNGEAFEQYEIIERDFINFIKIIPLNENVNQNVYSPVLRDIIIRVCIQIEIFLKEWSKYYISENPESCLAKKYNETFKKTNLIKGAKNWNIQDYYILKETYFNNISIYVSPTRNSIKPFETWKDKKTIPDWWTAYNDIKHNGIKSKSSVNIKNTLSSLSALFSINLMNNYSGSYLRNVGGEEPKIMQNSQIRRSIKITTPLDSKRYLFRHG